MQPALVYFKLERFICAVSISACPCPFATISLLRIFPFHFSPNVFPSIFLAHFFRGGLLMQR